VIMAEKRWSAPAAAGVVGVVGYWIGHVVH
jgi:hypothetical protein